MPDTSIETVGLNLEGTFAANAERDAAAADKLSASLGKLGKASDQKIKAPALDAITGSSGYGKLSSVVSKLFGATGVQKLEGAAAKLAEGAEKLGISPEMLSSAGTVLAGAGSAVAAGGAIVAAAAAALAAAAGALIYAGVKLGISEATKNEVQGAILDAVTGGKGDSAMKVATKVALDIGIDDDAAIGKIKKLLNAKFSEKQAAAIVKVGVGLDALEAGRGDAFVKTLETIRNLGKFDDKSIRKLAKEGIDVEAVYARLAKQMGISVDQVKAKIKSGTLDVSKGLDAVVEVANQKFGKVADKIGNSLPGLVTKIQVAFKGLFGNINLDPIKGVLKNVLGVLTGPAGAAFSKAFGKLSDTIIKALFGPIAGASGKKTMENIVGALTSVIGKITAGVKFAAPAIKAVYAAISELFSAKKGSTGEDLRVLGRELFALAKAVAPVIVVVAKLAGGAAMVMLGSAIRTAAAAAAVYRVAITSVVAPVQAAFAAVKTAGTAISNFGASARKAASDFLSGFARIPTMLSSVVSGIVGRLRAAIAGVLGVGRAIPAALGGGIVGAMGAAIAAAVKMAAGVVAAVKAAIGMRSPPKAFTDIGVASAQAQGDGMTKNAGHAARSGAKLAKAAAAGAAGGASGGGAAGAGGGGAAPQLNIVNNFAPGTTPAQAAAVASANAEEWKRQMRAWQREQQEGRAP